MPGKDISVPDCDISVLMHNDVYCILTLKYNGSFSLAHFNQKNIQEHYQYGLQRIFLSKQKY